MAIKYTKKNSEGVEVVKYKSSKRVVTPAEARQAEEFDLRLGDSIKTLEQKMLKFGILSFDKTKNDPLSVWYMVGQSINEFLLEHPLLKEDEAYFWKHLYGRFSMQKTQPSRPISQSRNDFKLAALLASYKLTVVNKLGSWALWREILGYKAIYSDQRVLLWIVDRLSSKNKTRNESRPLIRAIAYRLRKIETSVLLDEELRKKLELEAQRIGGF